MYKKRLERRMELARRNAHSLLEAHVYTWREGTLHNVLTSLVLFRHIYILKAQVGGPPRHRSILDARIRRL